MYLFKDREDAAPDSGYASSAGLPAIPQQNMCPEYKPLTGAERPRAMLGLLALLVLLLHVWLLLWLSKPAAPLKQAQPLPMEVILLAAPQVPAAVPVPLPSPPPPVKPLPQKKPKPLPKMIPVAEKPPEAPKLKPQPAPATQPSAPPAAAPSAPSAAPQAAVAPVKAPPAAEPFTEANFRANYGINPKPEYPRLARNRGWQGKVLLRVQVSAQGASLAVSVNNSSGHDILDAAAVAAVEKWQFIPARRGETPVASTVIVPIIFTLNE